MKVVTWTALGCSIVALLCAWLLTTRTAMAMSVPPVVTVLSDVQIAATGIDAYSCLSASIGTSLDAVRAG
jgi:hypothetical protein